jgi:hypothetical protein
MEIISYNISRFSQEKLDSILLHEADIYILPELACPEMVSLPKGYRMEWMGDIDFKGLGIVWKAGLKAEVPKWFKPEHQYFLPLLAYETLIMAAWPTTTEQNKPKRYPQIAMEALMDYEPYLRAHTAVIAGDMNCYKGQSGETKRYSIQAIFDLMEEWGFKSAYHQKTDELLGKESMATYHHQFKEESKFFLDYAFTNVPIKDYRLFEWNKEISDHVGQLIEI